MRSTFTGLEISKRSLFTQQAALQTTGHNISNANTRGYSRQVVNMVSARPLEAPGIMRSAVPGQIGQGVEFDQITRIRETFLDHQYYNENQSLGEWSVRSETLDKLQAIVNEPSDTGVRKVIEGFWNAWQAVSKEPDNVTARAALKEKALALTDAFNHTAKQMSDLSGDLTANIKAKASEANTYMSQIASLNKEINRIESMGGDHANDLRDQRDLAVDDLSRLLNVTVDVDQATGNYNVKMGTTTLVDGFDTSVKLVESLTVPAPTPAPAIPELALTGNTQLASGEIKGMVDSRDKYVSNYQFQLNAMVQSLVTGKVTVTLPKDTVVPSGTTLTKPDGSTIGPLTPTSTPSNTLGADTQVVVDGINGLHKLAYTLEDPPSSGVPFFTVKLDPANPTAPLSAANITVNPDIVQNVAKIASSMRIDPATGKVIKGNNDAALLLAGFKDKKFSFDPSTPGPILSNGTFSEFYTALVGQVGVQAAEAQRQTTNQQALVDQVDARRQSVSGVSLDEEMSNMIRFQHAYNAAARALTTFDEMLDKVINGMGLVGR